jgi:hypothetical protein
VGVEVEKLPATPDKASTSVELPDLGAESKPIFAVLVDSTHIISDD